MTNSNAIRIVLVEDDTTIREGYAFIFSQQEDFEVVAAYSNAEMAVKNISTDAADIYILDISLPGLNGIEAIDLIKIKSPSVHVIMLTVNEEPEIIFKALAKGVSGYLTKNSPTKKTIEAIKEVINGGGPMSTNVARLVMESFRKNKISPLTKRETEVLEHLASGKSATRIAKDLFIDWETVKTHMKNIYAKLNVNSKAEAIKTAREKKLI